MNVNIMIIMMFFCQCLVAAPKPPAAIRQSALPASISFSQM
ncbi:hypothetical protein HMPREF0208_01890 [Citrobacter koseri]|nr:hypothetical protein HMPREF3220_03650 [Citrobacter koseri]KXA00530.1 hypothetical protein HMPREF3207_03184 [Citrobacter koseri]KXB44539.1 hypothetical protein HMPREF0208_01890 [Citrobacter koseri]